MKYTGGCHCGKVKYEVEMNLGKPFSKILKKADQIATVVTVL